MTLAEFDLLLRGAALGLTALVAVLTLRLAEPRLRWYGFGLAVSVSAFLLNNGTQAIDWPDGVRLGLRLAAITGVYWFWALSRLTFEDRFEPRPWHAALVGAMLAAAVVRWLLVDAHPRAAQAVFRLGTILPALALLSHVLWRVARDRPDDLIERRRVARLVFVLAGAALPIAGVAAHLAFDLRPHLELVKLTQAAAYLAVELALIALLIDLRPDALVQRAPRPEDRTAAEEVADVERVLAAMRDDRLYRETGLTIGALAARLALPEYRLRRAINRRLGHRNFSEFLNAWRLREAAERLRDPGQSQLPILSIALELGYGSIGPFNRAFKAVYGITPSHYRRG